MKQSRQNNKNYSELYWELAIFGVTILLNMKVLVVGIKHYQLKIILIKLDYTSKIL